MSRVADFRCYRCSVYALAVADERGLWVYNSRRAMNTNSFARLWHNGDSVCTWGGNNLGSRAVATVDRGGLLRCVICPGLSILSALIIDALAYINNLMSRSVLVGLAVMAKTGSWITWNCVWTKALEWGDIINNDNIDRLNLFVWFSNLGSCVVRVKLIHNRVGCDGRVVSNLGRILLHCYRLLGICDSTFAFAIWQRNDR